MAAILWYRGGCMSEISPAWLAERLKKEGERVVNSFSVLTDEQWKAKVYTEGDNWTVRELLAQLQ